MYELIIIGGGPAGMPAAVYAARKQLNTLLITTDIGGQVNWTNGVENYMGYQFIEGDELMAKFQQQVEQFPLDRKVNVNVSQVRKIDGGLEVITATGEQYQGKAVILASGTRPRRLNLANEMALTGHGVTYCSICDGPDFTGQRVAVMAFSCDRRGQLARRWNGCPRSAVACRGAWRRTTRG